MHCWQLDKDFGVLADRGTERKAYCSGSGSRTVIVARRSLELSDARLQQAARAPNPLLPLRFYKSF